VREGTYEKDWEVAECRCSPILEKKQSSELETGNCQSTMKGHQLRHQLLYPL
jgi:hypothetical protein